MGAQALVEPRHQRHRQRHSSRGQFGVDGIEHCSCVTDRGFGRVSEETVAALARSRIAVCPTIGIDPQLMKTPPPAIKAMMDRMGVTAGQMLQARSDFVGRLHRAGVRLVSGVDSGIGPAKRHGVLPHAVCELVTAGLSVTEALATATSGAAEACGVSARKGRLAPGYDADLLVVDGDLETDVTALHQPRSMLLRGQPLSPLPRATLHLDGPLRHRPSPHIQ